MNNENIEIGPFDNLLVYKEGYNAEFVSRIIKERNLGGLRIFAVLKNDRLETLDFLQDYTFLEKLDITSALDYNFGFLQGLTRLRKLSISTEGTSEINLNGLHDLEGLSLKWRKKIRGLENCTKLSSLTLVEFKEKHLHTIQDLINLGDLRIKTSTIESLQGAEKLTHLQSLKIGNCKKLQSIRGINHLQKLKELYLDTCPNINDYDELTDLPILEILSLTDCGKVASLKFIDQYYSLSKLSLLGNTVIGDGDLLPAKRMKSIEHKHYSHYNLKIDDPKYNQNVKENLSKINKWFKG